MLSLLVENEKGYYNLLRIVSYRYEESDRWAEIPSVPLDVVNQHKEGLIAIAGDYFSRYGQNVTSGREAQAREYMDNLDKIFDREHLYLSVCDNGIQQQRGVNEFNVKLAQEMGREVVAVADVHYIKPEDATAHKVLRCISLKCTLNAADLLMTMRLSSSYIRDNLELVSPTLFEDSEELELPEFPPCLELPPDC